MRGGFPLVAAAGIGALTLIGSLAFSQTVRGGKSTASAPVQGVPTPPQLLTQPLPAGLANPAQVERGRYLTIVGDCVSCHTRGDGAPFAGGLGLNTPFGVIYSPNITSDAMRGWSPDQFWNAMHTGHDDQNKNLYPAFPYPYFSQVTRADADAILAYLQTVPPVRYDPPRNGLPFPLNIRMVVKGWNLLFFRPHAFQPDPTKPADWNRGAYIVNGLGHCGACHTPKNMLGADKSKQPFYGGGLDNWFAPDLTSNGRTGLAKWSRAELVEYLKTGRNVHSQAAGPMAEVVSYSTSLMSDADLYAMAAYLKDRPSSPTAAAGDPDPAAMRRGEAIYVDTCSACHLMAGQGSPRFFPPLRGDPNAQQKDASAVVHLILNGGRTAPTPTRPSPLSMPSYAWKLTDQEIADVSTYVRNAWGNRGSAVNAHQVRSIRSKLGLAEPRPAPSSGGAR